MMVLRVYRVDCYIHLLFSGFPRTFIYSVAYQFHASFLKYPVGTVGRRMHSAVPNLYLPKL